MGWKEDFERVLREMWRDVIATAGWKTRGNGLAWAAGAPVGFMNHHLVVPEDPDYEDDALSLVINGHSKLKGPLANTLTAFDGTIYLTAGEPSNNAGQGNGNVLVRVRKNQAPLGNAADVYGRNSDTMGGNAYFFATELQHLGTHPRYTEIQIRAVYAQNAALCKVMGWGPEHCLHHREWSYRKVDLSWQGDLRAGVRLTLNGTIQPPVEELLTVTQYEDIMRTLGDLSRKMDGLGPIPFWLKTLDDRMARDIVLTIESKVDALAKQRSFVTGHVGSRGDLDAWTNHRVETVFANLRAVVEKLELDWKEEAPKTEDPK